MNDRSNSRSGSERWRRLKGPIRFGAAALAVIWGVLPWLPEAWGVRFGTPYLVFFSLAVSACAGFFALLDWGPIGGPRSPAAAFASILFVYAATVGGMVAFGRNYHQFETPQSAPAAALAARSAEERGRALFLDPQFACFACHTIEVLGIRGGQRGPDLSAAGSQAEARKPGMAADEYLREAIADPWACFTPLPGSGLVECQPAADPAKTYPQLMPPTRGRMTKEQLDDLVAFMMSLRGARGRDGEGK